MCLERGLCFRCMFHLQHARQHPAPQRAKLSMGPYSLSPPADKPSKALPDMAPACVPRQLRHTLCSLHYSSPPKNPQANGIKLMP